MEKDKIVEELKKIVGSEHVIDEDFATVAVSGNLFFSSVLKEPKIVPPDVIVRPQNTAHVSKILKFANENKIPVIPAGSKQVISITKSGVMLDMMDMDKIISFEEDSLTVTVQAGCTWAKLLTFLEKKGYKLGMLGPHGNQSASIAAGISLGSFGIGAAKYGLVVDEMVSMQVVIPGGDVIRTGSRSNPNSKWSCRGVNGPDLSGLFCNQLGTLGVITETSLRIYPIPECIGFGAYIFRDVSTGLNALWLLEKTGYANEIMFASKHINRVVAAFSPEAAQLAEVEALVCYSVETASQKILNDIQEEIAKILTTAGGMALPPEAGQALAYDIHGYALVPIFALGSFGHTVGIGPVPLVNKHWKELEDFGESYAKFCTKVPGTDIPVWDISLFGLKQGLAALSFIWIYNPFEEKNGKKIYEAMQKGSELLGKLGFATVHIAGFTSPMEKNNLKFLKTLKKTIDPNNILAPGMLNFVL
jgi:FAD/FMN-containing dehydrogenase